MEIKEFVKKVISDIVEAVDEVSGSAQREVKLSSNDKMRTLEFDLAVSVETKSEKSGSAGIKVLEFAEGGGKISKETTNSTVSRIQFGVHVDSWTKAQESQQRAELALMNQRGIDDFS